ncbi:methyl-accepting chemotaxis sensory transducer [Rippkaea orientalis PCC 8801]|uniref:Methyl-accepting chemotaxis sensory transducer n=1 Tax=Rippkaea orientalis (strain PCC 8801 / RF-1) TaxID=41431 RepID=B7K4M8_RIPO1|nr:methyl-accepting chemotaxis protein [Rippkaea orientalis]ACK65493.1 methyl-accepting chemotaxis sensory transducer [Rippkaea orientalis PCC 8801]
MNLFKLLTIQSKLLSLLIFSAFIMALGAIMTGFGMTQLYKEVRRVAEQDLSLIQKFIQIQENQLDQVVFFEKSFRGIYTGNKNTGDDNIDASINEFNARHNKIDGAIGESKSLIAKQIRETISDEEKDAFNLIGQTLNQYEQTYIGYRNEADRAFGLIKSNQIAQAKAAGEGLQKIQEQLKAENTELLQEVIKWSQQAADLAKEHQQRTVFLVSFVFFIGIAANIILGLWITNNITSSLKKAVAVAEAVSAGNLTAEVEMTSNDEIGQLLGALKTMIANLNSLISEVQQSGIQITSSTTQMSASRKQLEATLTEQIASTNEVTTTAQEIANTSEELVHTMEQITEMSQSTADAANQGQHDLGRMEQTMRQLAEATTSIASKLGVMSEKAHNINSVVLTITKVADQTNLLSLNAAIEAEKAGEYGAGFAVVAREIRRLADQTAVATLEIEQMVKEMQSAVSMGVMEMDKFNKEVSSSVEDVGSISQQIAQVIEQVQSITPRFELVSKSMEEQARSAQHIREAMEQLSEGSEQTAYSLHDTHIVLERLDDAAQGLQSEISVFKVKQ